MRRTKFALADVFGVDRPPEPGGHVQDHPVQHAFGAGRSVYIPRIEPSTPPPPAQINYNFGNQYWTLPKNYTNLVGAVTWAANNRLAAEIQAPLSVAAELAAQKGSNTWLLHLVNFDFTRPVRDIAVCLRTPAGLKVQEASVESPDFESRDLLTATVRDGVVFFRVPRLLVYDLVQVKLASQ